MQALIGALLWGCSHHEPPTPDVSASVAEPDPPIPPPPAPAATVDAALPAEDGSSLPPHRSAQLAQTSQVPESSGAAFESRAAVLWQAIVRDDPDAAMPFFFPRAAYEQVKDVADPASDWKGRLVAAYVRDIHALHASLGDAGPQARFVGLDVPAERAKWIEPGEEWNKVGYFRVYGSKLRYNLDGERHFFDVKSLISWRGDWYVVHLRAFK